MSYIIIEGGKTVAVQEGKVTLSSLYVRWQRPSQVFSSLGVEKIIVHGATSFANTPADGDRYFAYLFARGNETKIRIGVWKDTDSGIFDLYDNDVLLSSGNDTYAAAGVRSTIVFTPAVKAGYHKIELRVNGKNAASSNYYLYIYGISISGAI